MRITALIAAIGLLTLSAFAADKKVEKPINFALLTPNPTIGDWQGEGGYVAQVFTAKDGSVQANILKGFDLPDKPIAVLTSSGTNFTGGGWTASIDNSHFTGTNGSEHFDLQHITRTSPTLGEPAPAGAVVLFDGTSLDNWVKKAGKDWLKEDGPAKWKLVDGAMECVPGSDCVISKQKFGDCHLHVEFRTICYPTKSAVFLETRYEVNINETYGRTDGTQAGGLDNTTDGGRPAVRPEYPPLSWQTFDIDFRAPRFDASGNKTENPQMTILLNGVKLYDQVKLDPPHGAAGRLGEAPTGPIMLQDHTTPIQYRNIWVLPH
jgi:hypothetical protein